MRLSIGSEAFSKEPEATATNPPAPRTKRTLLYKYAGTDVHTLTPCTAAAGSQDPLSLSSRGSGRRLACRTNPLPSQLPPSLPAYSLLPTTTASGPATNEAGKTGSLQPPPAGHAMRYTTWSAILQAGEKLSGLCQSFVPIPPTQLVRVNTCKIYHSTAPVYYHHDHDDHNYDLDHDNNNILNTTTNPSPPRHHPQPIHFASWTAPREPNETTLPLSFVPLTTIGSSDLASVSPGLFRQLSSATRLCTILTSSAGVSRYLAFVASLRPDAYTVCGIVVPPRGHSYSQPSLSARTRARRRIP
ncbi:hypothetical protein GGS23DRAFT_231016 [Durotheca rogersii]|uniref:uncharacterized protein n=1 Tax=Durotheca rogersii TaxID=419775 RepID=UPI00221E7C68|nr:uncharacterized protein GGS23DRAFT_231016 [Durotheca rogersii]KAI5860601.1 hypothetical protein GGS23DRAFT_231016 [Durotheca rogersii]